jgi:hypothetical protein
MKKLFWIMAISIVLASCASGPKAPSTGDISAVPGDDQSVLILYRAGKMQMSVIKWKVYVDGELRMELKNGETGRLIVPNGPHTVHAVWASTPNEVSNKLTINADSTEITIKGESVDDHRDSMVYQIIKGKSVTPLHRVN